MADVPTHLSINGAKKEKTRPGKMSSEAKEREGFSSSTTPASLTKILIRSLSRLNPRTPSNTVPLSSLSLNSVWLHDWWLVKVEGNGLAVSGFTSREGVGTRLFCSAAIVKRHYTTILEAKDGITVTLSGFINRDRAHENGFSFQICDRFQLGFPYSWEEIAAKLRGEESANGGSPRGKSGLVELNMSSGISTNTASVSFDDIPVTRIRDILMHPLGDPKDCALEDILGSFCSNTMEHTPMLTDPFSNSKSPVTVARKRKRTKADQKHRDGGKITHTDDTVMGECITPRRGVVTRSMSRLRNLAKNNPG
uniref:SANTA domain-containing protein n=1 Tax=Populus trichocarpa TaxID=3694 RepID=A0A2K1X2Q6_POPTR|eukprot:XP_006372937.2 protein EMBRYO DEFECTIVE 1674 [Populus trichocarpa]